MFLFGSITVVVIAISVTVILLRSSGQRKVRSVAPVEDILLRPEEITVNIFTYKTPTISGYSLSILSRVYHTALGRALISRFIIPQSNLNCFADCAIPESPTLIHSVPLPISCVSNEGAKDILTTLVTRSVSTSKHLDVADFYNAYKSQQVTPLQVAHAVLAAIEDSNKGDKPLRAITFTNQELLLEMAKASTARWQNGSPLSFLDGVPFSIKEDIIVQGYEGMALFGATFYPCISKKGTYSEVIKKLVKAGAMVIGLANMPELGTNAIGSSENKIHGQPRNPHNTDLFAGGSSSGSAVSVAAGLCPLSVGGDGGGSCRVPAAVCGLYTLKFTQRLMEDASLFSFYVTAPITSSPLDLAIYMDAICDKKSALDFSVLKDIAPTFSGVTIGIYSDWIWFADDDTVAIFNDAIQKLKRLGATVKEIKIPELEELRVAHTITAVTELSAALSEDVVNHFHQLTPCTLLVTAFGQCFSATDMTNAMKQRTRSIKAVKTAFNEVDLIATPTAGCPIPKITPDHLTPHGVVDGETIGKLDMYTFLASFTGVPAVTMPIGWLNERQPIGLQLMAPWYHDVKLIKYAMIVEASKIFMRPSPQIYYDILKSDQ